MLDLLILSLSIANFRQKQDRNLGPAKIAWMARRHGYKAICVQRLDLLTEDEIVNLCQRFINKKTIIGISTTLIQYGSKGGFMLEDYPKSYQNFVNAVARLREKYNNKLVIGGPSAVYHAGNFNADKVISGFGENKIIDYLRYNLGPRVDKFFNETWDIKNCSFRWHKTDFIQPWESVTLETSRGCIFRCKFCSYSEIGKRKGSYERGIEYIKKELVSNYNNFGTTHYILADDTLNDNDERLNMFCDAIENLNFKIKFGGFARLDLAHRHKSTIKRLYKNGFSSVTFGVETFQQAAAKIIGKSFNGTEQARLFIDEFFNDICQKDIFITILMIAGLPEESREQLITNSKFFDTRPYINYRYKPLLLMNKNFHEDLSIFDMEYEKYGYEILQESKNNVFLKWKNKQMTFFEAEQLCNTVLLDKNQSQNYNAFDSIAMMSLTKKTAKELLFDGHLLEYKYLTNKLINNLFMNYFKQLRDWSGEF